MNRLIVTPHARELIRVGCAGSAAACPFCGASAAQVVEGDTFRWRMVQCGACGARGPEVRIDTLADNQGDAERDACAAAVRAWGARAGAGGGADAARYQWLRAQHWDSAPLAVVADPKRSIKLGCDAPSLDRLDQMIDAAMAERARDG